MSEKEDLPHPIDNIMVSNAPNNKTISMGEGKGSLIDSHGVRVVVGLDRIGISTRYQSSGRGWRRWANQFNSRQGSNLESLDYGQEKVLTGGYTAHVYKDKATKDSDHNDVVATINGSYTPKHTATAKNDVAQAYEALKVTDACKDLADA